MKRKSVVRRKLAASSTKRRSRKVKQNKQKGPRTAKQYFAMPRTLQGIWDHVVQVPGVMKSRGLSLEQASKEIGLKPDVVLRMARSAFRRLSNGRYAARSRNRLLRVLVIPSVKGLREIVVRDSRQASLIGEYWAAVERYLVRGDATGLEKFKKKRVTDAEGKRVLLLTDLDELRREAFAGVFRFESIYGRAA